MPDAVERVITKATPRPEKPVQQPAYPNPPDRLKPPSMLAHSATPLAIMPRSVSKADICVMTPFMLIELAHRTATIIRRA